MGMHRKHIPITRRVMLMTTTALIIVVAMIILWPAKSASFTPPVWHPVAPKTMPIVPSLVPTHTQTGPDVDAEPLRPMAPPLDTFPYSVRPGDTLSQLAIYCKTDVMSLTALNSLADPHWLMIGQPLTLPCEAENKADKLEIIELPTVRCGE